MRLVSWCVLFAVGVFGVTLGGGCGSTSSNKDGSGDDGPGASNSNSSSGGSSSNSNSSGGTSGANTGGAGGESASSTGGTGGSGGNGGSGGSSEPASVECGGMTCDGLSFGLPGIQNADACCPEGEDEPVCGYDTATLQDFDFTIPTDCQERNSPGELDDSCPESPPLSVSGVSFYFPGCCLPSGKCGFMLDSIAGLITLDLGCIDSTMFLDGQEEPPDCSPMGGEGGAAN